MLSGAKPCEAKTVVEVWLKPQDLQLYLAITIL
ncbi:MAG: hypothetical protein JWO72_1134, partial [Caulobacteraceae bacterium]|nr:hypothetical protein [Caulobacteraceae bacterium]